MPAPEAIAWATLIAPIVEAASALAMVGLTWALVTTARASARDSKRMTDVMVREFELRMAPILEFTYSNRWSGTGWQTATVPITMRNLGHYPVEIVTASLEFRMANSTGHFIEDSLPDAVVRLEHGRPHEFEMVIPLDRVPAGERSGPTPRKNLVFRIGYVARSVTGAESSGRSQEFIM